MAFDSVTEKALLDALEVVPQIASQLDSIKDSLAALSKLMHDVVASQCADVSFCSFAEFEDEIDSAKKQNSISNNIVRVGVKRALYSGLTGKMTALSVVAAFLSCGQVVRYEEMMGETDAGDKEKVATMVSLANEIADSLCDVLAHRHLEIRRGVM